MKKQKNPHAVELGQRVRAWRTENGIELAQLATMLQISPRSLEGWELGEFCPGYTALLWLADSMGGSTVWLMGRSRCWKTADQLLREQDPKL